MQLKFWKKETGPVKEPEQELIQKKPEKKANYEAMTIAALVIASIACCRGGTTVFTKNKSNDDDEIYVKSKDTPQVQKQNTKISKLENQLIAKKISHELNFNI